MFKVKIPKSVLLNNTPKNRRCKECPRWLTLCKIIWDELGELPKIENCPIWDGRYDIEKKLWYFQSEHDVNIEKTNGIELKINKAINIIHDDLILDMSYIKEDNEYSYILLIDYEKFGRLKIYIEKRKIDYIIHDDCFLYNLMMKLDMMHLYVKTFHFMKKIFRKLQLKGTSNKIFFEAYDDIQLDIQLQSYISAYNEALKGLIFEINMSDKCISLNDIF